MSTPISPPSAEYGSDGENEAGHGPLDHDACCYLPQGCEGGCRQPGGCMDPASKDCISCGQPADFGGDRCDFCQGNLDMKMAESGQDQLPPWRQELPGCSICGQPTVADPCDRCDQFGLIKTARATQKALYPPPGTGLGRPLAAIAAALTDIAVSLRKLADRR
jgi:hypothetical protein